MSFRHSAKFLSPVTLGLVVVCLLAGDAAGQQITYYTFDNALNTGGSGFGCVDPAVDPEGAASNFLLCFNGNSPQIYSDYYPPNIDPNGTGSYHNALYLNYYSMGANANTWFSVPQDVTDGFTAYFAFRIFAASSPPADGFAFVIQNAVGAEGADPHAGCAEQGGSGPNVIGGGAGCLGYGGLDNSFAIEFDTYANPWDPEYIGSLFSNANHIAVQSCPGVNSPSHSDPSDPYFPNGCLIDDDGIATVLPSSLSDGNNIYPNVHEVVVEYSGVNNGDDIQIFLDPTFIPGTHTPSSPPTLHCPYAVAQNIGLLPGGKAYVGFTGTTESSLYETTEILAWTFTPHTTSSQELPLNSGTPTSFPFGAHTFTVVIPGDQNTSNIDMVVDANTISPTDFTNLVTPPGGTETAFTGSTCQVYEGTGGNCIIYTIHCVNHTTQALVDCPSTTDPVIPVKTAYESDTSITPTAPGLLRGDPVYVPISSIDGSGLVSCARECLVKQGQSITIQDNSDSAYNGTFTVSTAPTSPPFTQFTITPTHPAGTGGYLFNNVQDICDVPPFTDSSVPPTDPSYNPPCWQPNRIDGTTSGKTKNFSDFVALSQTVGPPNITSPSSTSFGTGSFGTFTVTTVGPPPTTYPVTIAIGGDTLPNGVTFVDNGDGTGTLLGTPAAGTAGIYHITFTPSNSAGTGQPQAFTLTVTQATVQVTVNTSPSGLSFTVDSNTYSSSQTFTWNVGDPHTISTTSPQAGGPGTQYTWSSWSDSGAISHGVTAPASATTYTAYFTTQYQLTTAVSPAGAGTVSPTSGNYYDAGTPVPLVATANASYTFSSWSGPVVSPSSASTTVVMNAAETVTANFTATVTSAISVTPPNLNFGDVNLGSSKSLPLTVKNVSSSSLNITNITFNYGHTGSGSNYGYTTQCGGTLKPGKTCTITVTLKAQDLGPGTATLNIAYNKPGSPAVVNLQGNVINPKAKLSVSSLSFGTVSVHHSSTKTVTLTSYGDTSLLNVVVSVTGSSDFSATTCPATMPQNTSCTISVTFTPSQKTSRSGTLKITDNASSSPQTVSLSGKGN